MLLRFLIIFPKFRDKNQEVFDTPKYWKEGYAPQNPCPFFGSSFLWHLGKEKIHGKTSPPTTVVVLPNVHWHMPHAVVSILRFELLPDPPQPFFARVLLRQDGLWTLINQVGVFYTKSWYPNLGSSASVWSFNNILQKRVEPKIGNHFTQKSGWTFQKYLKPPEMEEIRPCKTK